MCHIVFLNIFFQLFLYNHSYLLLLLQSLYTLNHMCLPVSLQDVLLNTRVRELPAVKVRQSFLKKVNLRCSNDVLIALPCFTI